ncbi:isoprenylcysteine carboxyl methyltransferase family protein [Pseudalkalibacillus sp. R45]|uniref:isoprenylcysteine carboxyl methyltransferase family protein n=1 Tax=Pseudalkalibacillus sp. R45 TaxID=3457433 RepID=UPI003FCEBA18
MIFFLLFSFIIAQRLVELKVARRNEKKMKARGAKEFAPEHYKWIVILHTAFLLSLVLESYVKGFVTSPFFPVLFLLFIVLQGLRVWTIRSLGMFWNTKIIILPNANVVKKGPFRFLRHPNYVVVSFELLVIPLMFNAFWTTVLFTILNALLLLLVRIPAEEAALSQQSDYDHQFSATPRFIPQEERKHSKSPPK